MRTPTEPLCPPPVDRGLPGGRPGLGHLPLHGGGGGGGGGGEGGGGGGGSWLDFVNPANYSGTS